MKKIVNPAICTVGGTIYHPARARAFAKIEFENGRLSICGVIGPTASGNARGSCGQCVDEIRLGDPVDGWNKEMLQKFCDIWDQWHLNDMVPYCIHQKELGWDKLAVKKVTLYNYRLRRESYDRKRSAESAAIKALKLGISFTPTEEQVKYATIPYKITIPQEASPEILEDYEPKKSIYPGDEGATFEKQLGWLYPTDHPDGILTKPCPVCGYKYGTAWKKEEVPQDVIDWLFALPDTEVQPAWC